MNEIDEIESKLNKYDLNSNKSSVKFQKSVEFETIKSDIICTEYSNKVFISITSSGKFGSLLYVRSEKVPGGGLADQNIVYSVKTLFGQSEETLEAFARSLAEKIKRPDSTKSLLVGIGLKKEHLKNIALLKYYENCIVEALKNQLN